MADAKGIGGGTDAAPVTLLFNETQAKEIAKFKHIPLSKLPVLSEDVGCAS